MSWKGVFYAPPARSIRAFQSSPHTIADQHEHHHPKPNMPQRANQMLSGVYSTNSIHQRSNAGYGRPRSPTIHTGSPIHSSARPSSSFLPSRLSVWPVGGSLVPVKQPGFPERAVPPGPRHRKQLSRLRVRPAIRRSRPSATCASSKPARRVPRSGCSGVASNHDSEGSPSLISQEDSPWQQR